MLLDGAHATVYPYLLENSETGEGSSDSYFINAFDYDELGNLWALGTAGVMKWDGTEWEKVGPDMPEFIHVDPEFDERPILRVAPLYAQSDGQLKLFGRVYPPIPFDRLAVYFITRSAAGEWEYTQVLERLVPDQELAFDNLGRARIFTSDAERFYIHREENGFMAEPWVDIPYPESTTWPAMNDYLDASPHLQLRIGYDHSNRAVGTFVMKFAPTWEYASFNVRYGGVLRTTTLLIGESGFEAQAFPLSAWPEMDAYHSCSLDGLNLWTEVIINPEMSPSGTLLTLSSYHITYTFDGVRNTTETLGKTLLTLGL